MDIIKLIIEFTIIFIALFLIYYYMVISKFKKNKKNMKYIPVEVSLILLKHDIDINKIDMFKLVKTVSLVTVMVLSLVTVIVIECFDNAVISILLGAIIATLIAIVCYYIIGVIYENKSKNIVNK